jgi:hypothetical protein
MPRIVPGNPPKGEKMGKVTYTFLLAVIVCVAFFGWGAYYNNFVVSYNFDKRIGNWFDLADKASLACDKAHYFDTFVQALRDNELTSGPTSIYFQQPTADMSWNFNTTLSLQQRLHELCTVEQTQGAGSMAYQTGMQEVSITEFCWFPLNVFYQGYALQHGAWGDAIMPASLKDRCKS